MEDAHSFTPRGRGLMEGEEEIRKISKGGFDESEGSEREMSS